ncbi:hypothetical protein A8924_6330 [Saccharopolyspora erythraea NRRL 2338]|uniref:Uncharacterized protein n=2 Tax=Saccharopolyspora erythraea TaxID=1836 RepID=A4FM92_SACEN|nr:DUF6346 domain-containing protein [Saccharopolyspora erythraea]EQD87813.1 hypothetical protein N599_02400 [Saccharopolyspora erythraea D]PFG98804.1 hypothetical protein A8924_6330 [Saccharopolyspora erythraea NRRL 2338]QRK88802.1 hypothetical protein JQX30_29985 [Saccharopolyspora erythraea]CAM05167.1 hypothetical protein SACE_5987 [Saccharopolyspora erythraea NRRL 2338]
MWNSDNIAIRLAKMLGGFVVVAVLVMLWPTIVYSFPEKKDNPNGTALVRSCEDTGPVTRRGFGHNWSCVADIRDDKTGDTWTATVDMNFFTPAEVGKQKRLVWGYGGSRTSTNKEKRTYTRAEDGYSNGTVTLVLVVTTGLVGIPALWMFSKSVVWSFSQAEQRKFWEKIHGSPEERAAKKKKDQEFWDQMRRNREQRKQARQQRGG